MPVSYPTFIPRKNSEDRHYPNRQYQRRRKSRRRFLGQAETLLYTALIGYIYYEAPANEQNFATLVEMLNAMEVREDDESFKNAVDLLFDALEQKDPDHFALRQYRNISSLPEKQPSRSLFPVLPDWLLLTLKKSGKLPCMTNWIWICWEMNGLLFSLL